MEVDLGLADEAIRQLELQGFHLVKSGGPLGRENLTFQNDAGEVIEARIEWKPAKRRNMKFNIRDDVRHSDNQRDYLQPPAREISERVHRPNKYHRGEYVKFRFGTVIREGRITTAMCINGLCFYHIEGAHGTWYREIYESDIINRIPHNNHGDNT